MVPFFIILSKAKGRISIFWEVYTELAQVLEPRLLEEVIVIARILTYFVALNVPELR